MTEHPQPPNGKEHWAIDKDGKLHVGVSAMTAVCGADPVNVIHYRQLIGRREEHRICTECLDN